MVKWDWRLLLQVIYFVKTFEVMFSILFAGFAGSSRWQFRRRIFPRIAQASLLPGYLTRLGLCNQTGITSQSTLRLPSHGA